jgi:hypothetical protein
MMSHRGYELNMDLALYRLRLIFYTSCSVLKCFLCLIHEILEIIANITMQIFVDTGQNGKFFDCFCFLYHAKGEGCKKRN